MGTNSIKSNLTKDDIASDIRLTMGADIKKENTFVIVEGLDDVKFWKNMVNEKVLIYESFSGKDGIKEIIEKFFNGKLCVIGIRDRDYENTYNHPQIFYYDYCCLEMMLISNNDAFSSIHAEYSDGSQKPSQIRIELLRHLQLLSLIRKNNEVNKWGIKLNGISINKIYDKHRKMLNTKKMIDKINEMNNNYFKNSEDKLIELEEQNKLELEYETLLNITQGHDFMSLFSAYCNKPKGNTISSNNICASLRCSYREIDFQETNLYAELNEYENKHMLKIVS